MEIVLCRRIHCHIVALPVCIHTSSTLLVHAVWLCIVIFTEHQLNAACMNVCIRQCTSSWGSIGTYVYMYTHHIHILFWCLSNGMNKIYYCTVIIITITQSPLHRNHACTAVVMYWICVLAHRSVHDLVPFHVLYDLHQCILYIVKSMFLLL